MTNYYNDYYFNLILNAMRLYSKVFATKNILMSSKKDKTEINVKQEIMKACRKIDRFYMDLPKRYLKYLYEKCLPAIDKMRKADFKKECFLLDQKVEYQGVYLGPRWILFTDLDEVTLSHKYGEFLKTCTPYEIYGAEIADVFKENDREDGRDKKAKIANNVVSFEEEKFEKINPKSWDDEPYTIIFARELEALKCKIIADSWRQLTEQQRERIVQNKLQKKSVEEIASAESVYPTAIYNSISRGLNKFGRLLNESGKFNIEMNRTSEGEA